MYLIFCARSGTSTYDLMKHRMSSLSRGAGWRPTAEQRNISASKPYLCFRRQQVEQVLNSLDSRDIVVVMCSGLEGS